MRCIDIASSCESGHTRCRLLESLCGASQSCAGRHAGCKDTRPCACAWRANAMQPGLNEVGKQLRLKLRRRSGHCGAAED